MRKTGFELSRVKLYRNNLKGNKNYPELARGSSYWESTVCMLALMSDGVVQESLFYTVLLKYRMVS